jgi:hypothetical protein
MIQPLDLSPTTEMRPLQDLSLWCSPAARSPAK